MNRTRPWAAVSRRPTHWQIFSALQQKHWTCVARTASRGCMVARSPCTSWRSSSNSSSRRYRDQSLLLLLQMQGSSGRRSCCSGDKYVVGNMIAALCSNAAMAKQLLAHAEEYMAMARPNARRPSTPTAMHAVARAITTLNMDTVTAASVAGTRTVAIAVANAHPSPCSRLKLPDIRKRRRNRHEGTSAAAALLRSQHGRDSRRSRKDSGRRRRRRDGPQRRRHCSPCLR